MTETLTEREREVARMAHRSNAQIAMALGITVPTVKKHLVSVYDKLGLTSMPTPRSTVVGMAERGQL